MSVKDEAELIMAVRDYSCAEKEKWDNGVDITVMDEESKEKVLLRLIESKSKSGFIGIDAVRKMKEIMEEGEYDKGFLVGKRFTDAAKEEMWKNEIKIISEKHLPRFNPEQLYLKVNQYVDKLCTKKCGKVPKKETDCKNDCRIRVISDNASFHLGSGWINLLKNDLKQLLLMKNETKASKSNFKKA